MNKSKASDIKLNIKDVFNLHPTLNSHGFGVFAPRHKTFEQIKDDIKQGQDELIASWYQVEHVINLVSGIPKIKSWNPKHTSYGLKHLAEKTAPKNRYIYNGAFIVGAIIAGFDVKQIPMSPNCYFNMSEKGIKQLLGDYNQA